MKIAKVCVKNVTINAKLAWNMENAIPASTVTCLVVISNANVFSDNTTSSLKVNAMVAVMAILFLAKVATKTNV